MKTEQENIKDFFTAERKKLISVAEVESMADVPATTLSNFLLGKRNLPEKHIDKVIEVLKKIGY